MLSRMHLHAFATVALGLLGGTAFHTTFASAVPRAVPALKARDTTNGTCVSAPQDACASLVNLCLAQVTSGQIASNAFWSSPLCFTAATCAGASAVIDAACCAGTCTAMTDMISLDYDAVYAPMVGSCAFQPNGCPVTWTDFVNYFYNTIVSTGTNNFPLSGDDVLAWWADIAGWTGFCSGDSCVDGQIPYLNFNDWLHFEWSTVVTEPGNPPIHWPPSSDRIDNVEDWDPHYNSPCATEGDACFFNNEPQEPPDTDDSTDVAVLARAIPPPAPGIAKLGQTTKGFGLQFANKTAFRIQPLAHRNLTNPYPFGKAPKQPPIVPPPVFINHGQTPVHLNLTSGSPTIPANLTKRSTTTTTADLPAITRLIPTASSNVSLPFHVFPKVTSDPCGPRGTATIDIPSPLPTLVYYCDYLPNICEGIRDSGFLTNDQVQLTYDSFTNNARRNSVCGPDVRAQMQEDGACDPLQHDPAYWLSSCDEFPMNSVLEGGAANGAVTKAVPVAEQGFQGTLHARLSQLLVKENNGQTIWSHPARVGSKFPGMCHQFILSLQDTRPAGSDSTAVGELHTGGAFLKGEAAGFVEIVKNRLAKPPPSPLDDAADYLDSDTALHPPGNYQAWDCSPEDTTDCSEEESTLTSLFKRKMRKRALNRKSPTKRQEQCTTSPAPPTDTASAMADATSRASVASTAAASATAAAARASSLNLPSDQAAAVAAAAAAATYAAAAASTMAASLASTPDDMSIGLDIGKDAVSVAQSALSSLTNIFHIGTPNSPSPPADVMSVANSLSEANSANSVTVVDTFNTKPADQGPLVPYSQPSTDPNINQVTRPQSAPGTVPASTFPAAGCFTAGSQGFLKLGDLFFVPATGGNPSPATMIDEGSDAFFGLTLPDPRGVEEVSGCPNVYIAITPVSQSGPFFQVDCDTNEFGIYWSGNKLPCYILEFTNPPPPPGVEFTFDVLCGNDLGAIYSCIQASGINSPLSSAFITWSTTD